jgi:hypothetical protein
MPLIDSLVLAKGVGVATLTRSTIGTFVDKDDGLVKTAAIDVARFESEGWLGEGAVTNLLLRSEEFDNASWASVNVTVTPDAIVAPDGASTADLVTSTASGNHRIQQSATTVAATEYTMSVFMKPGNNTDAVIQVTNSALALITTVTFDLLLGIIVSGIGTITPLINGWFKLSVPFTAADATSFALLRAGSNVNGTDNASHHLWGAQIEQLSFASSYIKTSSATVAKTLEDLDVSSGNIPSPADGYTVSMEIDVLGLDPSKTQTVFSVDGETSRSIEVNTTTGLIEATHGAVTSVSTTAVVAGTKMKIAFVVDGTNQTLYINGVQEDQDAKGSVTGTATAISIGNAAGLDQLFGHEKDFRIFNAALTANQIAAL